MDSHQPTLGLFCGRCYTQVLQFSVSSLNLFNALGGRNDFSTVVIQATVSVMQRAPTESNNGYPLGHVAAEKYPAPI